MSDPRLDDPARTSSDAAEPATASPGPSRRAVLGVGLAGVGVVALAGCSTSSSAGNGSTSAGTGGSSTSSGGAKAGAAAGLVELSAVPVGQSASAKLADGTPVIVTRTGTDAVVCHSAICTHLGCTVLPDGSRLQCPCHGSVYDARTGKVLGGPAPRPLAPVAVKVEQGEVVQA